MRRFRWMFGVITVVCLFFYQTGCQLLNPSGSGETTGSGSSVSGGKANVAFFLIVPSPEIGKPPTILTDIRAAGQVTTEISVRFLDPGSRKPVTLTKAVEVSPSGAAEATFSGLPETTMVGQVNITGGNVGGFANFHGAADLVQGTNQVGLAPVGSKDPTDVVATVVEDMVIGFEFLVPPTGEIPKNLATTASETVKDMIFNSSSIYSDAFGKVIEGIKPDSYVNLAPSGDNLSLIATKNGAEVWRKETSSLWNASDGFGTDLSQVRIFKVLRQGLGGFGYVSWKNEANSVFGIAKIDTATGNAVAKCLNRGTVEQLIVMSDNSLVLGGFNLDDTMPIVFRWSGMGNAHTETSFGLTWRKNFNETSAVDCLQFDGQNTILASVRNSVSNTLRVYRLAADTGNVDVPTTTGGKLNQPPIVQITSPSDPFVALAGSNVEIVASATDPDGSIARIEFFQNQVKLSEMTSPPFSYTVTNASAGAASFTVTATDNNGWKSTASVTIIGNAEPTVTITKPADGKVFFAGQNVEIVAGSFDDGNVSRVEFFQNGSLLFTDTTNPYSGVWTSPPAGSYSLTAKAFDNYGSNKISSPINITVLSPPSVYSTVAGNKQITVTWNSINGATSYNLYWSTSTGVSPANGTLITGVSSPFIHTNRTGGQTYYYVLTAVNADGESLPSAERSGSPNPLPAAPTSLLASERNQAVYLSWNSVAEATSYNLYWCYSNQTPLTKTNGNLIQNVTKPYLHTNLSNNTTYVYIVTAVGPSGESPASPFVSTTPTSLWNLFDLGNQIQIKLRRQAAGQFNMGSPTDEGGRNPDEDQYQISITRDFYIGWSNITQAQYRQVTGNNPAHFQPSVADYGAGYSNTDNLPVESVSWFDAIRYCNALSNQQGFDPCYRNQNNNTAISDTDTVTCNFNANGFRLPTEAEWEFHVRSGGIAWRAYWWGTDSSETTMKDAAWYQMNAHPTYWTVPHAEKGGPQPVDPLSYQGRGSRLVGNLRQWCWDWYGTYPGNVTDPTGPGGGTWRVIRGASFAHGWPLLRSANRGYNSPGGGGDLTTGIRLARTAE